MTVYLGVSYVGGPPTRISTGCCHRQWSPQSVGLQRVPRPLSLEHGNYSQRLGCPTDLLDDDLNGIIRRLFKYCYNTCRGESNPSTATAVYQTVATALHDGASTLCWFLITRV